ncbi:unnamed protein product [Euphydryas editha]|uniref:Uncharacterized protein n=1 Tax=Euphydryas editha TaxID=104508 RepID=A0AAU9U5T5_EUPED|nr:unnamed protein product [Euphydryas editha]
MESGDWVMQKRDTCSGESLKDSTSDVCKYLKSKKRRKTSVDRYSLLERWHPTHSSSVHSVTMASKKKKNYNRGKSNPIKESIVNTKA